MSLDCISPWPWLSGLLLLGLLVFFFTRGVLLSWLLASAGLLALFAFRFFSIWHQGLLFAVLLLHYWLAWVSPVRRRIGPAPDHVWPTVATGLLTLIAALHVWWAAVAGCMKIRHGRNACASASEVGFVVSASALSRLVRL